MTHLPALNWSTQLEIVQPTASQKLAGDKILLPPSALEQLLSASASLANENARKDLPAYDPYNSSTYSAYRRAESQYEDQRHQLPHPLTFRLVNSENGRVVYAGIREFSAGEKEAVLSPFLLETLGVNAQDLPEKDGGDAMLVDGSEQEVTLERKGPAITVHAKQLPRGTFVKLRPLEAGYDPDDWKALLEQHLRANYTTLTNGEVLVVPGGRSTNGKNEEFRFLVDGFKPEAEGICIVDTDLEVDIEALNEEQARETLQRIAAKSVKAPGTAEGSSVGGELDLFKPQHGQVLPGEYVDFTLPSWNRTSPIEFELDTQNDVETLALLINPFSNTQRAKPRIDECVFANLDTRPSKRIRLEPSNVELEHAEAIHISVHAYAPALEVQAIARAEDAAAPSTAPYRFTLRARLPDTVSSSAAAESEVPQDRSSEGEVRCKNCGHWVPQGRLALHEATCYRNNILCPKGCGQVFQKRSPDYAQHWHCPHDHAYGNQSLSKVQHDAWFHPHSVLRCTDCSTSETFSTFPSLAKHRTTTCPGKLILCRFCHLSVPQEGDPDIPNGEAILTGLTPHELADGARTTECHLCSKIVRLRDMETHLKNHDLDRLSRPAPIVCRNVLCGRTLDVCAHNGDTRAGSRQGQGAGNDVGLCATCYGPLYVSMYDPENKALRRRIERRYLSQLGSGCGKDWCRNEFCRSGRKNLGVSKGEAVGAKEALPIIKPQMANATTSGSSSALHFCADEGSQKRRTLADMLAAEDGRMPGQKAYDLPWCVGALEAEKGDLDAARVWLKNWAPTRDGR